MSRFETVEESTIEGVGDRFISVPETEDSMSLKAQYPNLYGLWGAAKETVKTLVPYLKYVDPDERERFMELSQQKQTRELLFQNLETVGMVAAGPITKGVTPIVERYLPKTYKLLTTTIGKAKPTEIEPAMSSGAKEVEAMYDRATQASKELNKTTLGKVYKDLKRQVVDVSGNVKKKLLKSGDSGKEAVMRHDLIAGAKSKATQDINDVSKTIFGGLSKSENEYLNRVIQSKRTIAIEKYKKIRHPEGLGAEKHTEFLDSLSPEIRGKVDARADEYFKVMTDQLDTLLKEGVISKDAHSALVASGDYSPRNFLQHIDPDITYSFGGKKITVPDSGIKRLAEGSEGLLEKDANLLLSQVIARTQTRVFRNRANKALYDLAESIPDNGVVSIPKKAGKVPAGHDSISVMIDGSPQEMLMPTEFAKEWVMRDPEINSQIANFIGWISGSKILKPMATGVNPEFALTNLPRDIAHVWLTTTEYSSTAPKAMGQMAIDFGQVAKDVILRKGRVRDYINEGGGMEFLTHQGKISGASESLGTLNKVLGYLGETSEMWTRIALRERALKNGATTVQATWIARNYLDFSQGGSFAKAVDIGVPYLNASIQGTRGIFRAASQKPGVFAYKAAQIGTLASSLYLANKNQNPEAWSQISDREKVNNWIITSPLSYKDKDGTKKYLYFKIAKDQGQRVIATIFENLMAKYTGEEINGAQVAQSVQDALPIIPTQVMPPSMDAIYGYASNKDFWLNEDIWRGPDNLEAKEEYTRYTPQAFVELGEKTGLSPERAKYALEQVFTRGNLYTSLAGHGLNQIFEGMDEQTRERTSEEILLAQPFIRRVMKSTDPYYQFEKGMTATDKEITTEKYKLSRTFDDLSQKFYNKEGPTQKDIVEFIKNAPITDRERLFNRHIRRGKIQNIPDKRWWLNLADMSTPEAKATAFWTRWRTESKEKQQELEANAKKIPGIASVKFFYRLKQLRSKNRFETVE